MATSVPTRRGPPYATATVAADEDYINRSLLDSVNAQGDAEPGLSLSDSETPGGTISTFATTTNPASVGSPSVPYHVSTQAQQQQLQVPHPDSPSMNNILPNYLQSPPRNADTYSQGPQNSQLYNSVSSLSSPEHDALNPQSKANGYSSAGTFRTAVPFAAFSNRPRQNTPTFRDTSSFPSQPFTPAQADIYITTPHATQSQQPSAGVPFESVHHPGRFDFAGLNAPQSTPSLGTNGQTKQTAGFSAMDAYRLGLEPNMPNAQQIKQSVSLGGPPGLMRDAQGLSQSAAQQSYQTQLNGLGSHPLAAQGYNGHSVNGPGSSGAQGGAGLAGPQQNAQQQPQEEISTIFVVGFPDDMSVRSFSSVRLM